MVPGEYDVKHLKEDTIEVSCSVESGSMSMASDLLVADAQVEGNLIPLPCSGATSVAYMLYRQGESMFLKRLRPEHLGKTHYHQLFYKEYALGSQMDFPYIVRYRDFHDEPTDCYLVAWHHRGV